MRDPCKIECCSIVCIVEKLKVPRRQFNHTINTKLHSCGIIKYLRESAVVHVYEVLLVFEDRTPGAIFAAYGFAGVLL